MKKNILYICLALILSSNAIAKNKEVQLGSAAIDAPIIMHQKITPLVEYLKKSTGLNVTFKSSSNLETTINDIAAGDVMISYLTPMAYINAHKKNPNVIALVSPIINNTTNYTLVIATSTKQPYSQASDLKGKSFAYGDPKAALQKSIVYTTGLTNEDFSNFAYLKHYDNIAKAILSGDFDAGILNDTSFDTFKNHGLKEIHRSKPMPGFVFAVNKSLGATNIAKIEKAFLNLNTKKNHELLSHIAKGCTGFAKTEDLSYDIIRQITSQYK